MRPHHIFAGWAVAAAGIWTALRHGGEAATIVASVCFAMLAILCYPRRRR